MKGSKVEHYLLINGLLEVISFSVLKTEFWVLEDELAGITVVTRGQSIVRQSAVVLLIGLGESVVEFVEAVVGLFEVSVVEVSFPPRDESTTRIV